VVRHAANPLYLRVMAPNKYAYSLHVTCPSSGHIISHPSRKAGLSHGQIICLVTHAIDVGNVLQFHSAMESIKTSNGQFPYTVLLCV